MTTRKWILLPLVAAVLTFVLPSFSIADTEFKYVRAGDWEALENAWQHSTELSAREIVHVASTEALNGRKARLGVNRCGRYGVGFSIELDQEFFDGTGSDQKILDATIIYAKTLFSKPKDVEPGFEPVFLYQGYAEYFSFDADTMVPAGKFMLCRGEKETSGCLTFSLKGFTAALKMVCPKR